MRLITFFLSICLLTACGNDEQSEPVKPVNQAAQSQTSNDSSKWFIWKDGEVKLQEEDFIGLKFRLVEHETINIDFDPYYRNGNYPSVTEYNFYKDGLVHKYYTGIRSGKAIPLAWEVEGNKLYINSGNRRTGTATKSPVILEFNQKPKDELVIKHRSELRGNFYFARIHDLYEIPDSQKRNPDYKLQASSLADKTITFSYSGGADLNNKSFHLNADGTGHTQTKSHGETPLKWQVEGNSLQINFNAAMEYYYAYTFQRDPVPGDEIKQFNSYHGKYTEKTERTAPIYLYDIQ